MPRRIWIVMTPEFPRAPMSAPNAAAAATRSADTVGPSASASASAARTVAIMFEPVSPSGTGKTLSAWISPTAASSEAAAARKAPRRPAPSHARRAISRDPSRDVRTALCELRGSERPCARARWRGAAGMELEPGDTDREGFDVLPDGGSNGVPNRMVDLTRDFGDRQSVGDAQAHRDADP